MKKILDSKTVWLNSITFILVVLALPEFISIVPASWIEWIALANAILNYILRIYFTSQPLTKFAAMHG